MAETYSTELTGVLDGTLPASKADGGVVGGRLICYRATITMASQAAGTIVLAKPAVGCVFSHGIITASATMGASATIAIGTTDDPDGYRAAATFTSAETPTFFGTTAGLTEGELDGETLVKMTTAVAALPSSGTVVVDLFYLKP
jgi:hypothetical protein